MTARILQYTHIYIVLYNRIQPYPTQDSTTFHLNKLKRSHICYKILPTQVPMEGMQENHVQYQFPVPSAVGWPQSAAHPAAFSALPLNMTVRVGKHNDKTPGSR